MIFKFENHPEEITADQFSQIHSMVQPEDLRNYRKGIEFLLNQYAEEKATTFDEITLKYITGKQILEVGCGGRASGITALCQFKPGSYDAIDISQGNLSSSKVFAESHGIENIKFTRSSALELPFENEQFDFILSDGVIHHTKNAYQCFQEMTRVVRPGGVVLIGVYGWGGIFGNIIHPFSQTVKWVVPFSVMKRIVKMTGIMRSQNYSLLDWLYTPIQDVFLKVEL